MSDTPALKLDWCSYAAAKYAVEHWHYSQTMIVGKAVYVGVWEEGHFIGCVIFSRGANNHIGRPYHLTQTAVCELTRIALTTHRTPVSRIGTIAIKLVHALCPGLRLLVSYADPDHGHLGGIYQAMGWIYTGQTVGSDAKYLRMPNGQRLHARTAASRYGTNSAVALGMRWQWTNKHKYLYPLDGAMRAQIQPLARPYPKRATSILADASPVQGEESGAAPTVALPRHGVT
jgi:hypothetical protein